MHIPTLLAAVCGLTSVAAVGNPHRHANKLSKRNALVRDSTKHANKKRQSSHLNSNTAKFAVNGTAIPEVDFDIGESYAGTLPVNSNSSNENALWFWFFPSDNPMAGDEITVWLNGGPGCSSLDGLLQENGVSMSMDVDAVVENPLTSRDSPFCGNPAPTAPLRTPLAGPTLRTWSGSISQSARASLLQQMVRLPGLQTSKTSLGIFWDFGKTSWTPST